MLPQERETQRTSKQIVHVPVPQIQEQSAVPGLMNPQFSTSAIEAPLVVDSFPLLEDLAAHIYNQVHQEQIVATVQPQAIVQEIPQLPVVERIQQQIVEPIEVLLHDRVQQFTAEQIVHMPVPQTQEQSAVTDLVNPPISVTAVEVVDSFSVSEEVATLADMTTLSTSSTSTSSSAPDDQQRPSR